MSFCRYCGKELSEKTNFCPRCGNPVESIPKQAGADHPEKRAPEPPVRKRLPQKGQTQKKSGLSAGEKAVLCVSLIAICVGAVLVILLLANNGSLPNLSKTDSAKDKKSIVNESSSKQEAEKPDPEENEEFDEEKSPSSALFQNVETGDIVTFGSYEQDNDFSNGEEPIEWLVLTKENGKALLISKYALDWMPYNETDEDVTWETCTLRSWLNEEFLYNAFTSAEQEQIRTTKVTADKNPDQDTDPGNDTKDKIFLLSCLEMEEYFKSDEAGQCSATEYVWATVDPHYSWARTAYPSADEGFYCLWWLRTPGWSSTAAAAVTTGGIVGTNGTGVTARNQIAVRPALWVSLS